MKKFIFIFTALPLLSFANIYSCDELLNDMHNSCNGSSSCVDNFYKYFHIISRSCIYTNIRPCYFKLKEPLTLRRTQIFGQI